MSPFAPIAPGPRRALDAADRGMATTLQRLSSGLRVNGARDDAAGLAISERLLARVRGGTQAARNANDAISMLQTADGTLQGMAGLLQRMREDLVQAMNGSNSSADVASLDADLKASRDELDRLAAAASFNGIALLSGDAAGAERLFQVGAGSDDTLSLAVGAPMRAADLGALAIADSVDLRTLNNTEGGFAFAGTYTTVPISDLDFSRPEVAFSGGSFRSTTGVATDYSGGAQAQFSVDGRTVTLAADYGSLGGVASAIQSQLDASRYTVAVDSGRVRITKTARATSATSAPAIAAVAGNTAAFTGGSGSAGTAASATTNAGFTIDGVRVSLTADHSGSFDGLVADIQGQLDRAAGSGRWRVAGSASGLSLTRVGAIDTPAVGSFTGAGASVFAASPRVGFELAAGDLSVQVGGGAARAVTGRFQTPQALVAALERQVPGIVASIDRTTGALQIVSSSRLVLSGTAAGSSGALAFESLEVEPSGSLMDLDATDADEARRSLLRVDAALDAVSAQRAVLGAAESRFDAVIGQLQTEGAAAAATRGRIVDADLGAETAALARQQVLQQAGMAMLAQANLQARQVLALIR